MQHAFEAGALFRGVPWGEGFAVCFYGLVLAAMVQDIRERRIANGITAALLVAGLAFAMAGRGLPGLGEALLGVLTGLGIWIVFHLVGALGAGDVKFFAAGSAFLGPALAWRSALLSALVGGLLAVVVLLWRGRLGATLRVAALLPALRQVEALRTGDLGDAEAHRHLPYGVALGLGLAVTTWIPHLLLP